MARPQIDNCGNYQPIVPDLPPDGSWTQPAAGLPQVVIGSAADPNAGDIFPPDKTQPAFYYQDNAAISFWAWSVSGQNWIGFITQS